MKNNKSEFQNKVYSFFKNRHLGEILVLKPASSKSHLIKFRTFGSLWLHHSNQIRIINIDFESKTISGFIDNSSKLE